MSVANEYFGARDRNSTATYAAPVTPSDSEDLPVFASALWVGAGGTIVVDPFFGPASVTLTGIANGTLLPLAVKRVRATGTTASQIVALA